MGYTPFRCRRRSSAAFAAALGIAASPIAFCNHDECGDHHHLPEVAIHAALTEPTVSAITTSGSMSGVGMSMTSGVGNLTAAGPRESD
jgi:hypothetical protein